MSVRLSSIPGPRGHFLLGALPDLAKDSLQTFADATQFGDLARVRGVGKWDFYVVSSPDDIARILETESENFPKGILHARFDTLFGEGMLTSQGENWKNRRKMETPGLRRGHVAALHDLVTTETNHLLARWDAHPQGQPLDILPEMMELTLRITGSVLFGSNFGEKVAAMETARQTLIADMNEVFVRQNSAFLRPFSTTVTRRFGRAQAILRRTMKEILRERRAGKTEGNDLLTMLLAAKNPDGSAWSDAKIVAEMLTMMGAGQETTAAALCWTWFLLAQNPEPESHLHADLDAVLAGKIPTSEDLTKLPFLKWTVDESMRLFPPIPLIARVVKSATTLQNHAIPAGSFVVVLPWTAHRDPRFWESPEQFDPARFAPERAQKRPKYAYFPFGGGARFCVGAGLATLEAQLVIAQIAQRFRLRLPNGFSTAPRNTIAIRPRDGLPMFLERRAK